MILTLIIIIKERKSPEKLYTILNNFSPIDLKQTLIKKYIKEFQMFPVIRQVKPNTMILLPKTIYKLIKI